MQYSPQSKKAKVLKEHSAKYFQEHESSASEFRTLESTSVWRRILADRLMEQSHYTVCSMSTVGDLHACNCVRNFLELLTLKC
jgi:hypothetical protein